MKKENERDEKLTRFYMFFIHVSASATAVVAAGAAAETAVAAALRSACRTGSVLHNDKIHIL